MRKRVVVLLARAPSAKGKTRLTAHLADDEARDLRERLLLDTLDAACATELPVIVCFMPDTARDEMRRLVGDVQLIPQRGDGLGERMRNAMNDALARGAESVVLIGSDLPDLPYTHLLEACDLLEGVGVSPAKPIPDLVFGPTKDGGFYLVGARAPMPDIFRGIDWDGPTVLAAVVQAAHAGDLTVGFASHWWDVDRPEDLKRLVTGSSASAPDVSCGPATARRVRGYLETDS